MKHVALFLAVAWLSACAAHNSHRVRGEPLERWWPLVDEALVQTQASWGQELPLASMRVAVAVEPVEVEWVPFPAEESIEAPAPVDQAALAPLMADALRQSLGLPGADDPADFVMLVELQTDLHDPGAIGMRVACELVDALEPKKRLARGYSGCMKLDRLYCHGCRDAWGGHGSSLDDAIAVSGGIGYMSTWCNVGGSSHGYVKH